MIAMTAALLLAQAEGFGLNTERIRFRSIELRAGLLNTGELDVNVGDLLEIQADGLNPVFRSRLEIETTERLDAFTLGLRFDFNLFRVAVDGFFGDWEGEGTMSYGFDGGPQTVQEVELDGDAWGSHFTVEWPALRYQDPLFEATLGPVLGANWFHEEVDPVPGAPIPFDGHINALVGSLGLRLGLAVRFDRVELSAEVEADYLFGQFEGMETRAALGLGLRF